MEIKDGLQERLVSVNRVTKVVKGGRIMAFAVLVVVGDGNGKVGIGKGKAKEVPIALQKAVKEAKKNMLFINISNGSVPYDIIYKYGATQVKIQPGKSGIISGGAMRHIFNVVGITSVTAKVQGSTNPYNILAATIGALKHIKTHSQIAAKRGLSLSQMLGD